MRTLLGLVVSAYLVGFHAHAANEEGSPIRIACRDSFLVQGLSLALTGGEKVDTAALDARVLERERRVRSGLASVVSGIDGLVARYTYVRAGNRPTLREEAETGRRRALQAFFDRFDSVATDRERSIRDEAPYSAWFRRREFFEPLEWLVAYQNGPLDEDTVLSYFERLVRGAPERFRGEVPTVGEGRAAQLLVEELTRRHLDTRDELLELLLVELFIADPEAIRVLAGGLTRDVAIRLARVEEIAAELAVLQRGARSDASGDVAAAVRRVQQLERENRELRASLESVAAQLRRRLWYVGVGGAAAVVTIYHLVFRVLF